MKTFNNIQELKDYISDIVDMLKLMGIHHEEEDTSPYVTTLNEHGIVLYDDVEEYLYQYYLCQPFDVQDRKESLIALENYFETNQPNFNLI